VADNHAVSLVGRGTARANPHDRDVPEIGDEMAVGRALGDLSRNLLSVAEADITAVPPTTSATTHLTPTGTPL
jgi:hypothetical protein